MSFTFATPVVSGATYTITVFAQPTGQTCSVANGSGTVASVNVTNIAVTCVTNTFALGGTISALTAGGMVLASGTDTLSVASGSTAFTLPTKLAAGASYNVTIQTQPTGLICQVVNGSGVMASAAVSDIAVQCGQWIWKGGSQTIDAFWIYGTAGTGDVSNVPGARSPAATWTDASGNFWLFGGGGYGSTGNGALNDLWQYNPSTGQWTWVSGSQTPNAPGTYGSQGAASTTNVPGARGASASWIDGAGNLWLFGGYGRDSVGTTGALNDLWKYSPASGSWEWVSGANTAWAPGQTAASDMPDGRYGAESWIDAAGNLWLFGGLATTGDLNDLWKFTPGTGQWTLVGGSQTPNAAGSYGTLGLAASSNSPGARQFGAAWTDHAGNLWLFGGGGVDANGNSGVLNDLWRYSPGNGQWTWMAGSQTINALGVYGTDSTSTNYTPGARDSAAAATDAAGNFWLFGGDGIDSSSTTTGYLNDLWEYNVSTGKWIWMGGSQTADDKGNYGTLNTPAAGNAPPSRWGSVSWIDLKGNFWLFGAAESQPVGAASGGLNDLWEFIP